MYKGKFGVWTQVGVVDLDQRGDAWDVLDRAAIKYINHASWANGVASRPFGSVEYEGPWDGFLAIFIPDFLISLDYFSPMLLLEMLIFGYYI